jgi:hypothetical protein
MMTLASIESLGTLLGIGVLYPIYQWSMNEDLPFLAGGVPYYICGVSICSSSFYVAYLLLSTLVSIRSHCRRYVVFENQKTSY